MSHGLKLLLMAAGTVITCIVCAVLFLWTDMGRAETVKQGQHLKESYIYDELSEYDGICVDGAELIALMEKYEEEEVFFLVKTKECIALQGVFYNRDTSCAEVGSYDKGKSPLHEDYINQSALFQCKVVMNENGVITGMRFVQR